VAPPYIYNLAPSAFLNEASRLEGIKSRMGGAKRPIRNSNYKNCKYVERNSKGIFSSFDIFVCKLANNKTGFSRKERLKKLNKYRMKPYELLSNTFGM